jgi:hypothetical protein
MPSDPAETTLRDILHHIDLAIGFVAGMDRAAFHTADSLPPSLSLIVVRRDPLTGLLCDEIVKQHHPTV